MTREERLTLILLPTVVGRDCDALMSSGNKLTINRLQQTNTIRYAALIRVHQWKWQQHITETQIKKITLKT